MSTGSLAAAAVDVASRILNAGVILELAMRNVQSVQIVVLGSRSVAVSVESYGAPGHAGVTVLSLFSQCSVGSSFLRSRLNCQALKVHGPGTLRCSRGAVPGMCSRNAGATLNLARCCYV